jgi:cellulose synthase operon protein C
MPLCHNCRKASQQYVAASAPAPRNSDGTLPLLRHEHGKVLIDAAVNYIGGPRAEIVSPAYLVADFMNKAWSSGVLSWRARAAASVLIARLISQRTEWWETLELLNRMSGQAAVPGTRPDLSRSYLRDWIRGHFLRKPKVVGKPAVQRRGGMRRAG